MRSGTGWIVSQGWDVWLEVSTGLVRLIAQTVV
jgi:hypothetical protein